MRLPKRKIIGDIIVAGLLTAVFMFDGLSLLELRLQDRVYQQLGQIHPDIVVIGIDEQAIETFGAPSRWRRSLMADAVKLLNSVPGYAPAVIALDILYVGESDDADADQQLAEAARIGGNVVTAARVMIGDVRAPDNPLRTVNAVVGFEKPFDALAQNAAYGHVGAVFDNDNIVRSAVFQYVNAIDGETMHSFPYEIAKKAMGNGA